MINLLKDLREPELLADDLIIAAQPTTNNWGWLPMLSLSTALGLLLVALAYNASRLATQESEPLYWFGLLVLFLPIAWRLFSPDPTRRERIALLIMLGIALYSTKLLAYPLYFTYYDELLHVRTTSDIIASGHLFQAVNKIA